MGNAGTAFEEHEQIVVIVADGSQLQGEVVQREWTDRTDVEVIVRFLGREVVGHAADYFDALRAVRRRLETEAIQLDCYGASIDVWPSPMSRDMGGGVQAYRTRLGQHAVLADLVSIWDTGPDVRLASVDEQDRYHQEWLRRLNDAHGSKG